MSTVTPADIEGRVRSLEEIFKSLHVSSDGCQKMLVCHLSKVNLTRPGVDRDKPKVWYWVTT